MHAGKTRNPHNPAHTPGGSSSGSAAAVGAGMIPLAVGTQTGGSVIRPASFCGVTGFKPTLNAIPREGVCMQSHTLDTVGVFAETPDDAALIASVVMDVDGAPLTPSSPRFALLHPPGWDDASPELHAAFDRVVGALGERVIPAQLPASFDDAAAQRAVVNFAEMAHYYQRYWARDPEALGSETQEAIQTGQACSATDYLAALACGQQMKAGLEDVFAVADILICPAAPGPAPEGLVFTGDSIFNGLWTWVGTPCVTVPIEQASDGLPIGVQLVGRVGEDAAVLAAAQGLWDWARAR